jgi:TM2 domain-containing membrane protein YozV
MAEKSEKSGMVTLLLCFFLGYIGIHRFYVGKTLSGVLYFFTLGLFGIGTLVDFVMILLGSFKDSAGKEVKLS